MDFTITQSHMFHGNCFDIMSDDVSIPAGSVNLILNVPPFGCRHANITKSRRSALRVLLVVLLSLSVLAPVAATWTVSCTTSQYVENDNCEDCPTGSISVGSSTRYCYCPENHARVLNAGEVHGYACYACDSGKFRAAGDVVPTSANDASTECFTRVNHENWGQIAKFTSADPYMLRYDQSFGKSVAVHGNNMIVGASANAAESYGYERFSWYSRDPPPSDDIFGERLSLLIGDTASARDSSVAITSKSSNEAWLVSGSPRSNEVFIYACMNQICYQGKTSSGSNGLTTPTDAIEKGYFGQSVAIDGETVLVGASGMYWYEDGGHPTGDNNKKGSVYVFTPATKGDYKTWVLRATLRADDGLGGDQFGRSVAISGDTIVVGAPGRSADGNAYIFTRVDAGSPNSNWTLSAKVRPIAADTQSFGRSVSVDGNHVTIGDPLQEKVHVFVRDTPGDFTSDWSLDATIGTDDEENHGYFGSNVVVKNDNLIVAAPGDPTHASNQRGAVLVFSRDTNTNTWGQMKEIISMDTPQGERDEFGRSLAFDGSTLVVGAYREENDVKGTAYVLSVDERSTGSSDTLTTAVAPPTTNTSSDTLTTAVAPPTTNTTAPPEKSSSMITVVAALVAAGIIGPGTVFSVMAMCFKPLLRRKLLQYGCRRLADLVVPDVKSDVKLLSVKMNDLEAFIAKQKLPRLLDITPNIVASDIKLDKQNVLGAGGYGAVFQASYYGAPVAVKALLGQDENVVVPRSVAKMMRREATIMCSLNHPNILRVRGVVPERGWIVMDLCEGGALDDWLQDPEEIIDDATKSRICSEIATGIAYLHMRDVSVVHGDLKTGNVLLTRGKSVRICDFGMSEAKNRSKTMTTANTIGKMALTVAWSAPELFEDGPKSFSTDVYALGVTLWEVYERRVPFGNMPEAAVVSQILAGKRPKFSGSDVPVNVKRIIEACWSASANERPMADKIGFILTDLWTRHAGRIQEEAVARSSAGNPE